MKKVLEFLGLADNFEELKLALDKVVDGAKDKLDQVDDQVKAEITATFTRKVRTIAIVCFAVGLVVGFVLKAVVF